MSRSLTRLQPWAIILALPHSSDGPYFWLDITPQNRGCKNWSQMRYLLCNDLREWLFFLINLPLRSMIPRNYRVDLSSGHPMIWLQCIFDRGLVHKTSGELQLVERWSTQVYKKNFWDLQATQTCKGYTLWRSGTSKKYHEDPRRVSLWWWKTVGHPGASRRAQTSRREAGWRG